MALSCCSSFNNCSYGGGFNQEPAIFDQPDCPSDLLCFFDDNSKYDDTSLLDFTWEMCDDGQTQPLPNSPSPSFGATSEPLTPFPSENTPSDVDFNCFNPTKRLKATNTDGLCSSDSPAFNDNQGQSLNRPHLPGLQCCPLEVLKQPMVFHVSHFDGPPRMDEPCLSPQSAAARQRRKKISEKTQELAKLIPGGSKMNTAQMLLAAQNYVKFMQAQVATLQLVSGFTKESEEKEKPVSVEGLSPLLNSPKMQEKLSEKQKCLVPKELVKRIAKDDMLKSSPSVAKQLFCLLE